MVQRRPLVLSGNFAQEADNTDAVPILGQIAFVSGFLDQTFTFTEDATPDVYLPPEPSGLLFVLEGGDYKLTNDGIAEARADEALLSGIAALEGVAPASASGLEAQRIAVEALASGNQALLNNQNARIASQIAVIASQQAIASGQAAIDASANAFIQTGYAIASGEYALGSGLAASNDAVGALSSGNAALTILITNPYVDENDLLGLIMALS